MNAASEGLSVLLTGATGFVGSRLAPVPEQTGHRVRAMTRHPDDYASTGRPSLRPLAIRPRCRRPAAKAPTTQTAASPSATVGDLLVDALA